MQYSFEIRGKDYFNYLHFEVDWRGAVVSSPIELNDEEALYEFFKNDEEKTITLIIAGIEYDYTYEDISSFAAKYIFEPIESKRGDDSTNDVAPVQIDSIDESIQAELAYERLSFKQPSGNIDFVITTVFGGESAATVINGEVVFMGNVWDYHDGCAGTEIAGIEVGGIWESGVESLAGALAARHRALHHGVQLTIMELTDEEFEHHFIVENDWMFED